jgi:hypothetical protein
MAVSVTSWSATPKALGGVKRTRTLPIVHHFQTGAAASPFKKGSVACTSEGERDIS